MALGTVKWFDPKKGFGFIIGPDGKDVFVHFSSIEGDGFRALKDGEKVEYDFIETPKGVKEGHLRKYFINDEIQAENTVSCNGQICPLVNCFIQ